MKLGEALRGAGVESEERGPVETPTLPSFGELGRGPSVQREVLFARYESRAFLVVPLTVYLEGDIAEEWVVSAGSPPYMPRTIFRLRGREGEAEWVFLGPYRDPASRKWPTIPLRDGVSKGSESRAPEPPCAR